MNGGRIPARNVKESVMKKMKDSPCLTCSRVRSAADCENKQCRQWQIWFLGRWKQINGYYKKYMQEVKK